jgi:hypothetical protein
MKPKKFTPTYSTLAMLMASPTEPIPEFMRRHHITLMTNALNAIVSGADASQNDWRIICDGINMLESLVQKGIMRDEHDTILLAVKAMHAAAMRSQAGKGIRLDGPGIQVIRGILEDYQTAIESLSHRDMVSCHRDAERRAWEIRNGKRKLHDVVVVAL